MESLYDGNVQEVAANEVKPAVAAPSPIKAPEPKQVEPPKAEPEPTVTSRGPPPSMKEQGSSMMAMASKFEDNELVEEEDNDDSSFEEVQKPVERAAIKSPTQQIDQKVASSPKIQTPKRKDSPLPEKVSSDVDDRDRFTNRYRNRNLSRQRIALRRQRMTLLNPPTQVPAARPWNAK